MHFKEFASLSLRKPWVVNLARGFQKRFTSQKGKEIIYNYKFFFKVHALRKGKGETPVVRPSGIYKGKDEKELRGLEAERSQAEVSKTVLASRNASDFSVLTLYRATYQIHYQF